MINRDKFDAFESAMGDQSIFSHLSIGCLTFGLTLGAEMLITYKANGDEAAYSLIILCGFVAILGVLFGCITLSKKKHITKIRDDIFAPEKLISDYSILTTESGETHTINNIPSGSR